MCAKLLVNSVTSVSLVCLLSMDAVTCVEFVLLGNVVEPYIADCVNEEVLAPSTVPPPRGPPRLRPAAPFLLSHLRQPIFTVSLSGFGII